MKQVLLVFAVVVWHFNVMAAMERLPDWEKRVIKSVAREYSLNLDETVLLFAIRIHENGKQGIEFGIGDDRPDHPARRHWRNKYASLRTQARWAAGTIKKRFSSLDEFAYLWCPDDPDSWRMSILRLSEELSVELGREYEVLD